MNGKVRDTMTNPGEDTLSNLSPEAAEAVRAQNAITMECLQHLWRSIPYGQEFPLSNGMTGRIKKFVEPRDIRQVVTDKNGNPTDRPHIEDDDVVTWEPSSPQAGIDVQLFKNGKHVGEIEFFITKTGWGMSLCDDN